MKLFLFATFLLFILAGCCRTPVRLVPPFVQPPVTASQAETAARANALKKVLAPCKVRAVGVNISAFTDRIECEKVVKLIKTLGFNRIYCLLSSEVQLDGELEKLAIAASKEKIPLEIVLRQRDFYRRNQVNKVIRPIAPDYPDLLEAARKSAAFCADIAETAPIAGITVLMEPHIFDTSNAAYAAGRLYSWNEKSYGINSDNDMMVREVFEKLEKIKKIPGIPPVTVAVPDFYHEKAAAGMLSKGKLADFAAVTGKVIVVSSGNVPSKLASTVSGELASVSAGNSITVAINIAEHTSVTASALRRRNWNDLVRALNYAISKYKQYPSFNGIVISPLSLVEFMRQEK